MAARPFLDSLFGRAAISGVMGMTFCTDLTMSAAEARIIGILESGGRFCCVLGKQEPLPVRGISDRSIPEVSIAFCASHKRNLRGLGHSAEVLRGYAEFLSGDFEVLECGHIAVGFFRYPGTGS